MQISRRKHIVVIVILVLSCLLAFKIETTNIKTVFDIDLSKIPTKLGVWQAEDIELPDYVYEILETKNVLSRRYQDGQDSLELTIVYSGNNRQSFHPPEICYVGGGVEITAKGKEDIPLKENSSLKTNKLTMIYPEGTIKAWYWFLVGDRFVDSFLKQQLYFVLDILANRKLQGALIRVSMRGESQDLEDKVKSFISSITPYLKEAF
ncbi:MAG: EpsI family protein [Candidatus Omnitrophica bacterium]|jgi:EpsI family protein|nr:EpsI family protein [Candidatus Omnitrophota bacterium]